MAETEIVRYATCRIDSDSEQIGTSFWIDENMLLTAAHVTDAANGDTVLIRTVNGEKFDGHILWQDINTKTNPGSDIALIYTDEMPDNYETLTIDASIPTIGTEVYWSGYAQLIGEPQIDRQRLGWGRVASVKYGNRGSFFEVDGLFNPGHSGSPVVLSGTTRVVGLISASAGEFELLEHEWENRVLILQELFNLKKRMGGMLFKNFTYEKTRRCHSR